MKRFLIVAAVAALPAAGCIQTLPDGSVAAAPQTSSLFGPGGSFASDAPPPQHLVRDGGRVISADPDPHIRSALHRDPCSTIGADLGACHSE
jgi:hypothetical protein